MGKLWVPSCLMGCFHYIICETNSVVNSLLLIVMITDTPVLHMRQEKLVLSAREVNTIECDIINCISANMSLWHNRKMLVQINGTYIQHQFKTSLFGVFICQADNVSNSSLVQEKGKKFMYNFQYYVLRVKLNHHTEMQQQ